MSDFVAHLKLEKLRTRLRSSLWFLPGAMAAFGIVLALVTIPLQIAPHDQGDGFSAYLFRASAAGSREMLSAIAASVIGVAGVAFSITIVVLAQAATQYTPRILRLFMKDRFNQFVLGSFVGVFAYCLVVLKTIRGDENLIVPNVAVAVALLLGIYSAFLIIFFVHHIASSIQASTILTNLTRETIQTIDFIYACGSDEIKDPCHDGEWHRTRARGFGFIQSIDMDGLYNFCNDHNVCVHVVQRVGDFIRPEDTIALVRRRTDEPEDKKFFHQTVCDLIAIGEFRTIEKDYAFGAMQIVDIALKALSPSINDVSTAVSCIDYLDVVFRHLVKQDRVHDGNSQIVRGQLIVEITPMPEVLAWSIDQLRRYGRDHPVILFKLVELLSGLDAYCDERQRQYLLPLVRAVKDEAKASLSSPRDARMIHQTEIAARSA